MKSQWTRWIWGACLCPLFFGCSAYESKARKYLRENSDAIISSQSLTLAKVQSLCAQSQKNYEGEPGASFPEWEKVDTWTDSTGTSAFAKPLAYRWVDEGQNKILCHLDFSNALLREQMQDLTFGLVRQYLSKIL